jgi:hypothetical protein
MHRKAAAVTLRLTEPWHDKGPRIVLAVFALLLRGLFCIVNVKLQIKRFCKKELCADARGNHRTGERNAKAYWKLRMKVNGKEATFTGAFHMDKKPMTAACNSGFIKEGPTSHAPPCLHERGC